MATLDDISMRGARLFGPLKAAAEKDQANESGADLLRPEVKAAWNARRAPGTAAVTAAEPEVNATDSVRTHWNPRTTIAPQPAPVPALPEETPASQAIDAPASSETPKPTERPRPNARPAIEALFAEWRQERGTEKPVAAEAPANIDPQPLSYRERMDAIKARRALRQSDQPPVAPDAAQRTPEPVKPVIDPQPQLTGSAAMRARLGVDESRNVDPRCVRERMHAHVSGQPLLPKVEPAPQPKPEPVKAAPVVPAPEPAKPVISAARIELDTLKASLFSVDERVEADPRVIEATRKLNKVVAESQHQIALGPEAARKAAQWRAEHPFRATLHDRGIKNSPELREAERLVSVAALAKDNSHHWESDARYHLDREKNRVRDGLWDERRAIEKRIEALEPILALEHPEPSQQARARPPQRSERIYRPDTDIDEPGMDF
ncbi:hypothetical protein NLO85_22275 [Pseudomonas savastanoi]|uniref:MobA/MobL protein domain-containing protein n=2 Tax=Pseudomonas savastanoi TaxID=29438 RepID=A0AAW5JBI8_PSESS|nr:hypothetical protein [Pseudomonas savastanoi]MCQ3023225.1 hypothetical protein [Pseudomonas savastanoi]